MDSITAIFNVYFYDDGTVLLDKKTLTLTSKGPDSCNTSKHPSVKFFQYIDKPWWATCLRKDAP